MKILEKLKLGKWIQEKRALWFPHDAISLPHVLKETFWAETSKPIVRLVLAIFISAFFLVLVKNAYHQAFMRLQALHAQHEALHTQWMQLLIEEGAWGNYDRIYKIATTHMGMTTPSPFNTKILEVSGESGTEIRRLTQGSLLSQSLFDQNGYFNVSEIPSLS